ncbi:MAG: LVIVD repeat-containing protein, partial [Gemmatimonadales bacterium]
RQGVSLGAQRRGKRQRRDVAASRGWPLTIGLVATIAAAGLGCNRALTDPDPDPGIAREPLLVATVPIPPEYGIHDSFVRDGLAFVSAWNTGLIIFDVGDGRRGGSPERPVEVSRIVTSGNGVPGGPAVHNAWWFHNPVSGEKRYVFVGQEGPGTLFSAASGDLYVVDVSDLSQPREVATLRIPGAGVHNVWMDEARQILYAAWYNAGVVAIDVSGTLSGDLSDRIVARTPAGTTFGSYVWGVMLAGGALWVNDMVDGFWRLDPVSLQPLGGGRNLTNRWGSDLWVRGEYAYTGTWGGTARNGSGFGDVVNIWRVVGSNAPVLVDSLRIPEVRTVSDLEVSDDGQTLVVTTERLAGAGFQIYDLANPARPTLRVSVPVAAGVHTGSLARIDGQLYLFAAKNPPDPALLIYRLTP